MPNLLKIIQHKIKQTYCTLSTPPDLQVYQIITRTLPDVNDVFRELMWVAEEHSFDEVAKIIHQFHARYIHELKQQDYLDVIKQCRMTRGQTVVVHGGALC